MLQPVRMRYILYPAHNLRDFSLLHPANQGDRPYFVHLYVDWNSQRLLKLFAEQLEEALCTEPALLLRPPGNHHHRPRHPENCQVGQETGWFRRWTKRAQRQEHYRSDRTVVSKQQGQGVRLNRRTEEEVVLRIQGVEFRAEGADGREKKLYGRGKDISEIGPFMMFIVYNLYLALEMLYVYTETLEEQRQL